MTTRGIEHRLLRPQRTSEQLDGVATCGPLHFGDGGWGWGGGGHRRLAFGAAIATTHTGAVSRCVTAVPHTHTILYLSLSLSLSPSLSVSLSSEARFLKDTSSASPGNRGQSHRWQRCILLVRN